MLMILGVWQPWFTYVSHTSDVTGAPCRLKSPPTRLFVHSCLRLSTKHKLWNTFRWEGGALMPGRISWEMASNDVKIIHVMAPAYQEAGINFTLRCCYYRNVTQVLMTSWSIITDEIHRFCCRKMWPMCYEKLAYKLVNDTWMSTPTPITLSTDMTQLHIHATDWCKSKRNIRNYS